jgi:hypothetical protein
MSCWMNRFMGSVLIILLAGAPELCAAMSSDSEGAGTAPSPTTTQQTAQNSPGNMASATKNFPDSPGTLLAKQQEQGGSQNEPVAQAPPQTAPENTPPQNTSQQQNSGSPPTPPPNNAQQPVGGAAAQLGRTTGGAASKPAGAALAPSKQGQSRSLLLRWGLIAGAGIAVGSVVALSHASPSRPPGTH